MYCLLLKNKNVKVIFSSFEQLSEEEETVDTEDKSNLMDVAGELNVKALQEVIKTVIKKISKL